MKLYLVPGLGYDARIFERLNFEGHDVTYINWIEPRRNEAIREYAIRLFQELPADDEIILIGHSFGAVVSQEIATEKRVGKIILISSIKSRDELPKAFKLLKPLGIHRLFTKALSIGTVKYWGASHGFSSKEDKDLFKSMVGRNSNSYLQWALKALSGWHPPALPRTTKIFQIHGTDDKTFPASLIKNPDVLVKNGSHIMLYQQPQKINELILEQLMQP